MSLPSCCCPSVLAESMSSSMSIQCHAHGFQSTSEVCIAQRRCMCPQQEQSLYLDAGYGKGGKVKRVLANRQSAQRSRIRKLQHISDLEDILQTLQDDVFNLEPQLTKLQSKQAGAAADLLLNVLIVTSLASRYFSTHMHQASCWPLFQACLSCQPLCKRPLPFAMNTCKAPCGIAILHLAMTETG